MAVGLGRGRGLRHGAPLTEPLGGRGRHLPAGLAQLSHRHYRFWRDLGYAIGALGLGLAASFTGAAEAAFSFVAISMLVSGAMLFWFGEETDPRLSPAEQPGTAHA